MMEWYFKHLGTMTIILVIGCIIAIVTTLSYIWWSL